MKSNLKVPGLDRLTRRQRKLGFWLLGLLLAYTVLGFLILPPIVRAVAVKKLSAELDREVSIQKVKLNPFTLSATIRGLLIKDPDGQTFVSWDEVYVNLQLVSLFGHPWVFKEVRATRPFVRVQMNKDDTFNFSDLVAKFSSNAPPREPSRPLALRIGRLHIGGAEAALTDLTPRTPFRRVLGPLDLTLQNFRTNPDNRNPYSFSGTTDAGEKFAWSGYFYLDPLRSGGEISLEHLSLNKYAPFYQDLVRFQIRDGIVDLRSAYRLELSSTHPIASVTNASFDLHSFKLAQPDSTNDFVDLPALAVSGVSADLEARRATVDSVSTTGARLSLRRDTNEAINVIEMAQPAESLTNAPGTILLLLRAVTNQMALLLQGTNAWTGTIHSINFRNCALNLEDLAHPRPARLALDQIAFEAKDLSNLPGSNLTASLSLRWNTNGLVRAGLSASLQPPTADLRLFLTNLDLGTLDSYLEPRLNIFIVRSKLGLDGRIRLRTPEGALPEVKFDGNAWLNDFATVDGVLGERLLGWRSIRVNGIDANLNPLTVAIRQIAVDDADARIVIETNRTINLLAALGLTQTNRPAATPAEKAAQTPRAKTAVAPVQPNSPRAAAAAKVPASEPLPRITIGTLVISNAQVNFTDRSVTPAVHMSVERADGTLAGLSSEEFQHADVNLRAVVDNAGPVEITGTINPLSGHQTNDVKIAVKDVDLTPVSPYSGKFAGYRIARGKLALALAYHLRGRELKADNQITLDQFTFGGRVNSPDATKLPVQLAVAVLKDRNGRIELDVPVEGNLDDPKFKLRKVILHALGNILTRIVTSPFAALSAVFGGHGEELSYQDFTPGLAALSPADTNKLNALVKGLYERPGLQVEIEGSVDPASDREGLRRVLLERQLRLARWQSLRQSVRETTTAEQITLTPDERTGLIHKLYRKALDDGRIDLAKLSANTNTVALAAQLRLPAPEIRRGATVLMEGNPSARPPAAQAVSLSQGAAGFPPVTNPEEQALLNTMTVTGGDLEELAMARAKAVRAYLLEAGKVDAARIYLAESQPGGVREQGARAYLQLR